MGNAIGRKGGRGKEEKRRWKGRIVRRGEGKGECSGRASVCHEYLMESEGEAAVT